MARWKKTCGICQFAIHWADKPTIHTQNRGFPALSHHILVVDDDLTIRQVLCRIFNRAGIRTTEAENGLEALQHVRRQHFDLITMDMAMAQMDGVDAISILQNETPIPIVVISAHLSKSVQQDLDNRRILYRIEKPFSTDQVLAIARKALGINPA